MVHSILRDVQQQFGRPKNGRQNFHFGKKTSAPVYLQLVYIQPTYSAIRMIIIIIVDWTIDLVRASEFCR